MNSPSKSIFARFVRFSRNITLLGIASLLLVTLILFPFLPDIETLKDTRLQVPMRVFAQGGELMAEFGEKKRSPLNYNDYPPMLINAILASEDARFFEHPGVDYQGILRAVVSLVRTGQRAQGGSTITMQVARNFFLSREKTFLRKFNEILLAFKIENKLSKETILELYLNKIYLGKRSYGFAAAAQVYYNKSLNELSLPHLAMLAGLPKAPSRYNPVINPARATIRRNYVLGRMLELGYILEEEHQAGIELTDDASVYGLAIEVEAPYVAEMVRAEMLDRFGNDIYTSGYKVVTTIDAKKQTAANTALRKALLDYDRRHGYRGVVKHIDLLDDGRNDEPVPVDLPTTVEQTAIDQSVAVVEEQLHFEQDLWDEALAKISNTGGLQAAVVVQVEAREVYVYTASRKMAYIPWEKIEWARSYINDNQLGPELNSAHEVLKEGDVIMVADDEPGCSWLAQVPTVSGSLVSMQPNDGAILALVGGFDYFSSKFNRAMQAQRQPGSSFKPFVYTAALDKGYTAASMINDAPVVFDAPGLEDTWRPENYSGKFYGPTRLRKALINSRNLVSIRLLRSIGIGYATRFARRFGFKRASLPRDLSLALGSGTLTPLELATGYTVFANGGFKVKPFFIDHIVDADDKITFIANPVQVCVECVEAIERKLAEEEARRKAEEEAAEALAQLQQQAIEGGLEQQAETGAMQQDGLTTVEPLVGEAGPTPVPVDDEPKEELAEESPLTVTEKSIAAVRDDEHPTFLLSDTGDVIPFEGPIPIKVAPRILSPQISFLINSMMRDVIRFGTGRRALQLGRKDLAGKTGTTNDQRDAWFSGFNANVVAIAWVGFDSPKPLGARETGARAALPMWIDYMREALHGMPNVPLEQPPGLVSVRIDEKTGKPVTSSNPNAIFEYFFADQVPKPSTQAETTDPTAPSGPSNITEQLF